MRRNCIELAALLALLAAAPFCGGQPKADPAKDKAPAKDQKAPAKSKLEEMLEQALLHNPDIRVAEAKLREAEAELNRARLLVTQKVVTLQASLEAARANVAVAETRLKRLRELGGAVSREEI